MKIKIAFIYILSLCLMFLCSCSEIADTSSKELRSGYWAEKNKSGNLDKDVLLSLYFKGDDGVIKIKDYKEKKTYTITGMTLVTENQITISDTNTLTDYTFDYDLKGDKVNIVYKGRTLTLNKIK
ncbi:MAG: hypothetical protein J1F17_01115 [Oscillospiraceae bacterium]|nr:hypothetical protein [Oscillospiraceae bacterium]